MPNIPLFVQICLLYPTIEKTNAIFQNLALSFFSIYSKISSCNKLRTFPEWILRKMCHRQTDGQMNRTDFLGPLSQRWRLDHVFQNFENKMFLNYLAWLWAIRKWSIQNKCQRYTVDWRSNQKPFRHYQYIKIIQSICSIRQIICEICLI